MNFHRETEFGDIAWAYMSQFSRDTNTDATIWNEQASTTGHVAGRTPARARRKCSRLPSTSRRPSSRFEISWSRA